MPRVSHVVASLKRKKRIFRKTKGFWGGRSRLYRTAVETLKRSMAFAYRDRRDRKGDFRQLWIVRINAACQENGITYSKFINGLKIANIAIDRKILAELAVSDAAVFSELVKTAKNALTALPAVKKETISKKPQASPRGKPSVKAKKEKTAKPKK